MSSHLIRKVIAKISHTLLTIIMENFRAFNFDKTEYCKLLLKFFSIVRWLALISFSTNYFVLSISFYLVFIFFCLDNLFIGFSPQQDIFLFFIFFFASNFCSNSPFVRFSPWQVYDKKHLMRLLKFTDLINVSNLVSLFGI